MCFCYTDDLYELIGYVGDDEAQYECRTCISKAGKPVPEKADWLVALEKNRVKGFSIVCASILDKKYSQPVARIDEEELKRFYDKHKNGKNYSTLSAKYDFIWKHCLKLFQEIVFGVSQLKLLSSK